MGTTNQSTETGAVRAGGGGVFGAMAAQLQAREQAREQAAQAAADERTDGVLINGRCEGLTMQLLNHLRRVPNATAAELSAVINRPDGGRVYALLNKHIESGLVVLDRRVKPALYSLQRDPDLVEPPRRAGSLARALLASGAEVLRWIPISQRPKLGKSLLCWGSEGFTLGWCQDDGEFGGPKGRLTWRDSGGMPRDDFTHWAEPEGPPPPLAGDGKDERVRARKGQA